LGLTQLSKLKKENRATKQFSPTIFFHLLDKIFKQKHSAQKKKHTSFIKEYRNFEIKKIA